MKLNIDGASVVDTSKGTITLAMNEATSKLDTSSDGAKYAIYRGNGDPLKGLNAAKAMKAVQVGKFLCPYYWH